MRDYGKVYSTFWSSETTGQLSDDGKLLALYLMTCSHSTIAGVYRLPDGYVSEDLSWGSERVQQGFDELFRKGFANRCGTTKWVWVCKHLEWNKPENPNQRKSASKIALSVPDACVWKRDFMRDCGEVLAISWEPPQNPSGTLSEGLLNQEQKQEQKQDSPSLRSGEGGAAQASRQPPPASKKREQITLSAYLALCKAGGKKPVPDDHFIRRWCEDAGIGAEMLQVAWVLFRERYTEGEKAKGKRYKDWAKHFGEAVKGNWFRLWYMGNDGKPVWSSDGLTHKAALDARLASKEAHHGVA